MHQIEFKESVFRDLKKLDKKTVKRIFVKFDALRNNPYKLDIKKLYNMESFYRVRSGDYRIICQILDGENRIVVHYVRHRKEVYRIV